MANSRQEKNNEKAPSSQDRHMNIAKTTKDGKTTMEKMARLVSILTTITAIAILAYIGYLYYKQKIEDRHDPSPQVNHVSTKRNTPEPHQQAPLLPLSSSILSNKRPLIDGTPYLRSERRSSMALLDNR
jgi:uncharacterized membrane protein YebE (DUF533 family)